MLPAPERMCALWCPDWPVFTAVGRDPAVGGAPLAVVEPGERGLVVVAASAQARAEGVVTGLRKREAEARCAGLVVVDGDDDADARAFEPVVRAVEQLVPRLVMERPGRLSFPTRGPSRYFGGDEALATRVLDIVHEVGAPHARVGIADGALAARLAARRAELLVVAPGDSVSFLAAWPVRVLTAQVEGGAALAHLLTRLGLRTLGDFAALPEAAVLGRFGAAGMHAQRLARGLDEHPPAAVVPSPDLTETVEFDPPVLRVDEALFAAKSLADRFLARLDDLGLCCMQMVIEAETEHGEQLARCWRHEGSLTPALVVTRVRWQLDGWLTDASTGTNDVVTGSLTHLRLIPDVVVPATGRQLGFWGGDAGADRAGRAFARVQATLGYEAVVTAAAVGGRTPSERVAWVRWGEARPQPARESAPWPGAVPGPAPSRVFDPPVPAELVDAAGQAVAVSGRGEQSAPPAALCCSHLPNGGGPITSWAGPWVHDLRWWDRRRRRAVWQVVVADDSSGTVTADHTGVACLVAITRGRAALEAIYD